MRSAGATSPSFSAASTRISGGETDNFLYAGYPHTSPQAVAQGVFQCPVSDVEQFVVLPEHFVEGGDTLVVEGRYQGTMKATGRPVDAQFAHVWRLREGKVIRFRSTQTRNSGPARPDPDGGRPTEQPPSSTDVQRTNVASLPAAAIS